MNEFSIQKLNELIQSNRLRLADLEGQLRQKQFEREILENNINVLSDEIFNMEFFIRHLEKVVYDAEDKVISEGMRKNGKRKAKH